MPTCACIVPHPTELRVLLFREERGWSLPTVEYPGGWIAEQAGAIARRLSAQLQAQLSAQPLAGRAARVVRARKPFRRRASTGRGAMGQPRGTGRAAEG